MCFSGLFIISFSGGYSWFKALSLFGGAMFGSSGDLIGGSIHTTEWDKLKSPSVTHTIIFDPVRTKCTFSLFIIHVYLLYQLFDSIVGLRRSQGIWLVRWTLFFIVRWEGPLLWNPHFVCQILSFKVCTTSGLPSKTLRHTLIFDPVRMDCTYAKFLSLRLTAVVWSFIISSSGGYGWFKALSVFGGALVGSSDVPHRRINTWLIHNRTGQTATPSVTRIYPSLTQFAQSARFQNVGPIRHVCVCLVYSHIISFYDDMVGYRCSGFSE